MNHHHQLRKEEKTERIVNSMATYSVSQPVSCKSKQQTAKNSNSSSFNLSFNFAVNGLQQQQKQQFNSTVEKSSKIGKNWTINLGAPREGARCARKFNKKKEEEENYQVTIEWFPK